MTAAVEGGTSPAPTLEPRPLPRYNLYRAGTACEISLLFAVSSAGYAVWLAYGLALGDIPLILVDLTGLVGATTALVVAVRLRRRRPCPTGIALPQGQ